METHTGTEEEELKRLGLAEETDIGGLMKVSDLSDRDLVASHVIRPFSSSLNTRFLAAGSFFFLLRLLFRRLRTGRHGSFFLSYRGIL